MILNAMGDRSLPVYGDGGNVRDWLHVEDHCSAIDAVLHKGKEGGVYNIGGNAEQRNIDVVKMILHHLGKPESLINFIVKNYHPKKIRICIGEVEKEKWQKLGFSTSLAFYNDDLFESKYALIEKKRSVQNITQW